MKRLNLLWGILFLILVFSCDKTELYEYPSSNSNEAIIFDFSLLNEKGENVIADVKIDSVSKVIDAKVIEGTSINKLVPRATVSEGVIVEPIMGVYTDFTNPVTYTLIAGNRKDKETWTVVITTNK